MQVISTGENACAEQTVRFGRARRLQQSPSHAHHTPEAMYPRVEHTGNPSAHLDVRKFRNEASIEEYSNTKV